MTGTAQDAQHGAQAGTSGAGVLTRYLALAVTWGSSFLLVAVALDTLAPAHVVVGRLVAGALALLLTCAAARRSLRLPLDVALHLVVVGVLLCVLPFLLFAWAQQQVPSGVASVLNATTPLMTVLVAVCLLPSERPTAARVAGLLLAVVGVAVLSGAGTALGQGSLLAHGACLLATTSYGVAFVHLRRFVTPRGLDVVVVATVQVGAAALVALAVAPLLTDEPVVLDGRSVAAVVALGALGTGLAYGWNARIVGEWGATRASTVTYLTPVVGVALGALVLGEPVGVHTVAGAALVVAGVVTSTRPVTRPARRPVAG